MKIAILGTRGIPNNYGGFEQFAQYLSVALVKRGYDVYVYCSSLHSYKEKNFHGVTLIHCFDPENKMGTAGQFIYDLNCIIDARKRNFDAILQLGYTSSSVWYWLLTGKAKIITNMDGLEWKRSKYNKFVQRFLLYAEKLATTKSDLLVSDSLAIQNYLKLKYNITSTFISYGADPFPIETNHQIPDEKMLTAFGLNPFLYYLIIARFEPENNIETIIKGYIKSGKSHPLIIVGSAENKYGKYLLAKYSSGKVLFTGALYDLNVLNHLRYFSLIYFHGHSVGGTNPSLLEAMAAQAFICAHQNEFNEAVLQSNAFYFNNDNDISILLQNDLTTELRGQFIHSNQKKIKDQYNWKKITDEYESLLNNVSRK